MLLGLVHSQQDLPGVYGLAASRLGQRGRQLAGLRFDAGQIFMENQSHGKNVRLCGDHVAVFLTDFHIFNAGIQCQFRGVIVHRSRDRVQGHIVFKKRAVKVNDLGNVIPRAVFDQHDVGQLQISMHYMLTMDGLQGADGNPQRVKLGISIQPCDDLAVLVIGKSTFDIFGKLNPMMVENGFCKGIDNVAAWSGDFPQNSVYPSFPLSERFELSFVLFDGFRREHTVVGRLHRLVEFFAEVFLPILFRDANHPAGAGFHGIQINRISSYHCHIHLRAFPNL